MYLTAHWWLEAVAGSGDVSLMWISTGRDEKAFAIESLCWQNTRNLWLPHVHLPTIPLKVFRGLNPLPRLPTLGICWWREARLGLSSTFRGL